jgi:TRAP-type C4-dicarboxylate transport system substrate-binding protein
MVWILTIGIFMGQKTGDFLVIREKNKKTGGRIMRCKCITLLLVGLVVLAMAPLSMGAEKTISLTYANYFPPTHASVMAGQFCDEVKKRTNGRMEIAYHPGGTLATGPKIFNAVVQGVADIGLSATPYNRGRFPVTEILDLPLGFPSAWVSGQVQNDFYNKFKPKEWDDVHVLYFHSVGPFLLNTLKKPVKTLEDLKGLKISAKSVIADTMAALGATPIPLEQVDVYESLKRGVIDGIFGPFEILQGWKFGELTKYTTLSWKVGSCATFYVAMNKEKYGALPPDLKKIFDQVSAEYKDKFLVMWNQTDINGRDFLKEKGGQMIPLSDAEAARWVKAVQPVLANYKSEMVKKGFAEKDIDGHFAFIKERIEYWKKVEKERKIPTVE